MRPFSSLAWKPLAFPDKGFIRISEDQKIEEETLPKYVASRFYPAQIGETIRDRYQIVGKLGFGAFSTVWLARDLSACQYVALKLSIHSEAMGYMLDNELKVYNSIASTSEDCLGRSAVRPLLDTFNVEGPAGQHRCLVHPPFWESVEATRYRNPILRLPKPFVAFVLKRVFEALDFLHTQCHVAHTDIKEANMLLGADESIFRDFEQRELDAPCPRKEVDGRIIYLTRELNIPKEIREPVLCDFGSALPLGDGVERHEDIQPNIYRAPEIILGIPWTYSVDMWNVGCVVWDAFEGGRLFTGRDPELSTYRGRAHLAEMIALLGPPPPSLLARATLRAKFFSDTGEFCAGIPIPESTPLEKRETTIAGEEEAGEEEVGDRLLFLRFMRKMLQWEPEKRSSARELLEDEWIVKHTAET
ncbi:kinase-like domain-containing protein [Phyllosticta capitalensis]